LVAFILATWLLIQLPWVQYKAGKLAAGRLEKILGTRVEVDGFQLGILNRVHLSGVRIFDTQGDTLMSVGFLKLALTDWFPWKDTTELKYVGLTDAHLKFQRTDTLWNDQFLEILFSGKSPDTSKGRALNLKLEIVEINNLKLERLDYWRGKYITATVQKLVAKGRTFDLQNGLVEMDYVQIEEPAYQEIKSKGRWPAADSIAFWRKIDSIDALPRKPGIPNPDPFIFTVKEVEITSGGLQFFNRRTRPSTPGEFDERDIIITAITGGVKNLEVKGDTIKGDVRLKANERSGFRIESLTTKFTMHPQLMEFANLDLQTNRSRLGPYYAMRYDDFDDMEYFIDRVQVEAHLRNAQVDVEDVAVFAPQLKGIVQRGTLSGDAYGAVSDFVIKNVDLRTGKSRIAGNYAMKGLIDIDQTIIDFTTTDSRIYLTDVEPWAAELKELRKTPVANLGIIGFAGTFKGTAFDFFVDGAFKTDAGKIEADLKLKLEGDGKGYTSNISYASLDGGRLLGVPKLGNMVFSGQVNSNGFGAANPVKIDGTLSEMTYGGYTYHDLKAETVFEDYLLTASFGVADPNLAGNITTTLNFRDQKQRYKAEGNISNSNFYNLKLFGDTLIFKGDFDVDFTGNKVDDFLGYARFYNASVSNGKRPLSFDSLLVESSIDTLGSKRLSLLTNEASGFVEGRFDLSKLPASFSLFLNRYYPALIPAPEGKIPGQDFSFDITTREPEPFFQLFDKNLGGGNYARIFGSLNTETRQLLLHADIPSFKYGNLVLSGAELQGNGSINELNIFGSVANVQVNDQIAFPNTELRIATIQDSTRLSITTKSSGPLGNAAINADFFSQPEGFELRFNESSFIANKKKWTIEADGGFQLVNKMLMSDGLVLVQEQQRIEAFTYPAAQGNWNELHLHLNNFSMGDWLSLFLTDPRLEGLVTGKSVISDPMGKPVLETKLTIDQFYFNEDSVGFVSVEGRYDSNTELLNGLVKSDNPSYDFDAEVGLNFSDTASFPLNSKIVLHNERISVLKKYLTDIFDHIDGFANGALQVVGPFEKPAIIGSLKVSGVELKVGYTQCSYRVDTATVWFGDNFIDFGSMTMRDQDGRQGRVEGKMYHRFFDSLGFNLRLRTDGMQVLNTLSKDNDLFYGNVVGKATLDLTGPLNNMQMRITGTPTDTSWIAISNEESRTSGEADFIVFKEYGTESEVLVDTSVTNIHILLDITANPLCRVDVVLDELTGDVISATGSGNLTIRSGTADPTEMRGRYVVQSGSYNYTFQTFIRKPFMLDGDGNNFLEWTGDPYEANMNIKATYIAKDVSLRDLVSNENSSIVLDQNARNYKGDVLVNANITGLLSRPDIKFSIEFPPGSVMRNNITANDLLRRISEDESENLRQVTYLIVFRSFAPFRQGTGARNPGANLAVNTISELVSNEMEKILTGVIQDITRDKSLSVDLSTNFYNSSQTLGNVSAFNQYDRVNFDFNLNRSFFNSRVKVNLGSDFDLNVRNTTATGFQFLPDVSVEFVLTTNRRLRAIVFKRDNLDISGRRNRAGASISYRKDFEKLFGRKDDEALFFIREKHSEQP
jgi:hypothetical protein